MADAKTNETPVPLAGPDESALPDANRHILSWVRAQRRAPETPEMREWGERFRTFIAEHPFAVRGHDAG